MRTNLLLGFTLLLTFAAASTPALTGCGSSQSASSDSSLDAASPDAGALAPDAADATTDAAPPSRPAIPVKLPAAAKIPFTDKDILVVSRDVAADYGGALVEDTSVGKLAIVFERYLSQTEFKGELRIARLEDNGTFGPSASAGLSSDPFVVGAHAFAHGGDTFVYFQHGDVNRGSVRLARARFENGGFAAAEDLVLADSHKGNYAWPCPVERGGDDALSYDHYADSNHVALGDGRTFGAAARIASGVQGRVASFASGALAYTWQNGDPANMIAYVRLSSDAVTWAPQVPITSKVNVHDVTPFRRADGGVDIYFIAAESPFVFQIVRRPITENGTLGPEEIVSTATAGSLTQPHPHRLHDGSVGLVFGMQITSNIDTDTGFVRLEGDAPRAE